ncbi:MAG TPA: hypothetical protein VIM84_05845 [Gemmatimonadales bacterium]
MFPSYQQPQATGKQSQTPNAMGLNPEAINGNSLTQYLRSLTNGVGNTGMATYQYGQDIFGRGLNAVPEAQDTTRAGLNTIGGAVAGLNPVEDYWKGVMAGGPQATAAVAPFASQVSRNLAGATTTAQQMLPRGGYGATVAASLPQQAASQVNNALLSLQPQAAQQLQSLQQTRGQLGTAQAGVGGLQGQLADLIMRGGLAQGGMGSNLLQLALQGVLQERGQDVAEHGQAMGLAGQLGSSAMGTGANVYRANLGLAS